MGRKRVIFYLIDGARPDVLSRLAKEEVLPNIHKYLIERGSYTVGTTCFPSTTGPAYLPFLTGSFPGDHHITGIRWFDKAEYFKKSRWARSAMRSYCGYEARYFDADMDKSRPSLFEEYPDGLNLYNMITKGVKEENDLTKKEKTGLYFKAHFYHQHHQVDKNGHNRLMQSLSKNASFTFAVFPSIDWDSHTYHYEDERTIEAYKIVDDSLGELAEELTKRNEWDDTLLVMASDHGLSATHSHFDLGDFFKSHHYRVLEYPKILTVNPNLAVFISGNSFASISFLDKRDEYLSADLMIEHGDTIRHLLQQEAIDFIVMKKEKNAYSVMNSTGEAVIRVNERGHFSYRISTGDVLMLNHSLENLSDQEAYQISFNSDYPDALFQCHQLMQSHRSGDLVISAKTGFDLREFWEFPEHLGSHGSLHWEHMHVPILTNQKDLITHPVRTNHLHGQIKNWLQS